MTDLDDTIFSAIEFMLSHRLSSAWSSTGSGWQELWLESTMAGAYASCDGLILLKATSDLHSDLASINESIFSEHLCLIYDESVPVVDSRNQTSRDLSLGITMKVAKLLQAYAAVDMPKRHSQLMAGFIQLLSGIGDNNQGTWGYTIYGENEPKIAATLESSIALNQCYALSPGLRQMTVIYLAGILSDQNESIDHKVMSLWTLANIFDFTDESIAETIRFNLIDLAGVEELRTNRYWDERFQASSTHNFDTNDYYSFNIGIMFISSAMEMVRIEKCHRSILDVCEPFIERIAISMKINNYYRGGRSKPYFWEHFQALYALNMYRSLQGRDVGRGLKHMFIKPKHFRNTALVTDPALCVVLMPFQERWSQTVFNVFQAAGTSKGLNVWRSDLQFTDDAIMQTIWEQINKARIIIADCSGRNPNVFYELGLAHTIGKPVFICAQNRADIPFDIANLRNHEYDIYVEGLQRLNSAIESFIDAN